MTFITSRNVTILYELRVWWKTVCHAALSVVLIMLTAARTAELLIVCIGIVSRKYYINR